MWSPQELLKTGQSVVGDHPVMKKFATVVLALTSVSASSASEVRQKSSVGLCSVSAEAGSRLHD